MSTNCIHCVIRKRTGLDLLCDKCRDTRADWFCQGVHRVVNDVCENCGQRFPETRAIPDTAAQRRIGRATR